MQRLNEEKEKEVREARLNFFTMIAHEIRTPVSLIIGPLEKLMKVGSPTDDLRVINRNAHRLLELVNQLLDFRKVEQQSLVIHFAPQNIHELIKSISERFAPTFEQGGKHFSVEFPDEQFTAIIDREAVTKVVSNLLTNANKYTTDEVRLSCHAGPDEDHFQIVVADNGIGIKEEDQQRIFEPFFQAEGNKPGTGIGLNIVKNIVDLHHGTISVASAVGKGSTFTVVLPVSQQVIEEDVGKLTEEKEPYTEADRLNISRSGLFAKIKTLADVTPNEMIQIVRLKRAAQLLHEGGHLVSEVGYMVGFSNPSYFSKCFQKQFGIRPTDYIKKD